jgi:hypothetical protein
MSKSVALINLEVGFLVEHWQYKGGFPFSHEIHFKNRLCIFENVLFFLDADRLKYLSYPRYKCLIVQEILEEKDFRN